MPVLAIGGVERRGVHHADGVDHEPGQMVLGQPLPDVGRQQERLLAIAHQEVLRHADILNNRPDRSPVCATASHESSSGCSSDGRRRSARRRGSADAARLPPMNEPDAGDESAERVRRLMDGGADLAGAVGAVGATVVAGPVAGAALGVAIKHAVAAVGRLFSRREEQRIGVALLAIQEDARARQERGERVRADGFFDPSGELRPEGEELLEGVLREAAASYEERKVPLLAHLYSAVAHDESVRSADALYLVRLASDLTFRQFVILSAFATGDAASRRVLYDPELDDLGERLLVGLPAQGGGFLPVGRMTAEMTYANLRGVPASAASALPADLVLSWEAGELVRLTAATTAIPQAERDRWVQGA
jgi:hypothetical protein